MTVMSGPRLTCAPREGARSGREFVRVVIESVVPPHLWHRDEGTTEAHQRPVETLTQPTVTGRLSAYTW